jgi:hypothetical protein
MDPSLEESIFIDGQHAAVVAVGISTGRKKIETNKTT